MKTEHVEQTKLVQRVRNFYPDVIVAAIPNGGGRSATEGARLKAEGVLPGMPDLIFAEPRAEYHGLFIEMKREKGGKLSSDQLKLLVDLALKGYFVCVGHGADDAWGKFERYMKMEMAS